MVWFIAGFLAGNDTQCRRKRRRRLSLRHSKHRSAARGLVAVPPQHAELHNQWDFKILAQTLFDTLTLVKIRSGHGESTKYRISDPIPVVESYFNGVPLLGPMPMIESYSKDVPLYDLDKNSIWPNLTGPDGSPGGQYFGQDWGLPDRVNWPKIFLQIENSLDVWLQKSIAGTK